MCGACRMNVVSFYRKRYCILYYFISDCITLQIVISIINSSTYLSEEFSTKLFFFFLCICFITCLWYRARLIAKFTLRLISKSGLLELHTVLHYLHALNHSETYSVTSLPRILVSCWKIITGNFLHSKI